MFYQRSIRMDKIFGINAGDEGFEPRVEVNAR